MAKPILPQPGSNPNELGAPSPWIRQEVPEADYPGALKAARDPRTPEEMSNLSPEPAYPGQHPHEPWKSAPAPAPRRFRRGL